MPTTGVFKIALRRTPGWTVLAAAALLGGISLGGCTAASESLQQVQTPEPERVEPTAAGASGVGPSIEVVVPPDGPGDLSVVSVPPQDTLAPIPVGDSALVEDKFSIQVHLDAAADVGSGRPGEIAGDALTVTAQIRNQGSTPRDVSTLFVTVEDAEGEPLSPLFSEPYAPVDGHLQPQELAEGTYVFTLTDTSPPYTVRVSAAAEEPAAVFVGSLSEKDS